MNNMFLSWFADDINLDSVAISVGLITILLIIVLLIILFIVYRIGRYTQKLSSFQDVLSKVNHEQDKTSEVLLDMKYKLDMLQIKIDGFDTSSKSPLTLSKFDEDIANELNIDSKLLNLIKNESNIMQKLSQSKNPYDIQVVCIEWSKQNLNNFLDHLYLDKIKNKAYSLGIPEDEILYIFGIKLRDIVFSELNITTN